MAQHKEQVNTVLKSDNELLKTLFTTHYQKQDIWQKATQKKLSNQKRTLKSG